MATRTAAHSRSRCPSNMTTSPSPVKHPSTIPTASGSADNGAMWTVPSRIVGALALVIVTALLAGCGGMSEDEARNEVHERVDKLAERIGTNPRVTLDGPAGMDPEASTLD